MNAVLSKFCIVFRHLFAVTLISLLNICSYHDILTFQEVVFHMPGSSKEHGISRERTCNLILEWMEFCGVNALKATEEEFAYVPLE